MYLPGPAFLANLALLFFSIRNQKPEIDLFDATFSVSRSLYKA